MEQEGSAPTDISSCAAIQTGAAAGTHGTACRDQSQDSLPNMDCSVTEFDSPGEESVALPSHSPLTEIADISSNQQILSGNTSDLSGAQSNTGPSGVGDPTHQEDKSAFLQILDQMQKRQLNMDIFERIRKVYGDLECEYCGNFIHKAVSITLKQLLLFLLFIRP